MFVCVTTETPEVKSEMAGQPKKAAWKEVKGGDASRDLQSSSSERIPSSSSSFCCCSWRYIDLLHLSLIYRWRCGSRTGGPSTSDRSWKRRAQRTNRGRREATTSTDGESPPSRLALKRSTWPQRTEARWPLRTYYLFCKVIIDRLDEDSRRVRTSSSSAESHRRQAPVLPRWDLDLWSHSHRYRNIEDLFWRRNTDLLCGRSTDIFCRRNMDLLWKRSMDVLWRRSTDAWTSLHGGTWTSYKGGVWTFLEKRNMPLRHTVALMNCLL